MKRLTHLFPFLGLFALPFVTSCGGATMAQRPEARPDPQAEMDEQEARLHEALQSLEQAGPACDERCHAGGSICDAARRICELASELGDDRSQGRCASASASCMEANGQLSACHCVHDVPDAGRVKSSGLCL
jgi:hypothetical protein